MKGRDHSIDVLVWSSNEKLSIDEQSRISYVAVGS